MLHEISCEPSQSSQIESELSKSTTLKYDNVKPNQNQTIILQKGKKEGTEEVKIQGKQIEDEINLDEIKKKNCAGSIGK